MLNQYVKFVYMLCVFIVSFVDHENLIASSLKSTTGNIFFDSNNDGFHEMVSSVNGLGLGTSSPSENLHVVGDAIISSQLSIGSNANANSTMCVSGSLGFSVEMVSDNTLLSGNSFILANTSNGNIVLVLPAASTMAGRMYTVKKSQTPNHLTLNGAIDDSLNYKFSSGNTGTVKLLCDGTQWWVIGGDTEDAVASVSSSNLVGWWKMDETSVTGNAEDSSPNFNSGSYNGAIGSGCIITGKIGNALDFDGIDDYVNIPDQPELRIGSGNFTICFWAKLPNENITSGLFSKRQTSSPYEQLSIYQAGNHSHNVPAGKKICVIFIESAAGSPVYRSGYTTNDVADGNWHHITCMGDQSINGHRVYIDAVSVAVTMDNVAGASWPIVNNTNDLRLGNNGASDYMKGAIDDVRLFNRILSAAEVQSIYEEGQ